MEQALPRMCYSKMHAMTHGGDGSQSLEAMSSACLACLGRHALGFYGIGVSSLDPQTRARESCHICCLVVSQVCVYVTGDAPRMLIGIAESSWACPRFCASP